METYEMVEYRPGRWAKIDARTGSFLGPAEPEEVQSWQLQLDLAPDLSQSPTRTQGTQGDDLVSSAQPGLLTVQAQPAALEDEALPTQPEQPAVRTELDDPESQEPAPPKPAVPEKEASDPDAQHPDGEGTSSAPVPPQPAPEKKKAAPKRPAPKPPKVEETGAGYPLTQVSPISADFRAHQARKPPSTAPGIDFACPRGTEVRAWAQGKVIRSRWSDGGGRCLWLEHEGGIKTYYAHLRAAFVLEGEVVAAGQKIGESGKTGQSTEAHLHFSVVRDGTYVDPEGFVKT